jgi:transposase
LGTLRHLKLEQAISARRSRKRDLVVAMVVARIIDPGSKLALARSLNAQNATSTLSEVLGIESATEVELYEAMDWLVLHQQVIEQRLAKKHLAQGSLVLYDLSSTYLEGQNCSLAKIGYSRDGKKGTLQIVFGLLCDAQGCPVAVEVFEGNTADSTTLQTQVKKVQERFGLKQVVLVGDRGVITQARISEDLKKCEGLDWITALRACQVQQLFASGVLSLSLFDRGDWVELTAQSYPDERLIACRNSALAQRRAQKREELLQATEQELNKIVAATQRSVNRLRGKDAIGVRVGKVINRFKMAKHFSYEITDDSFNYHRNLDSITTEARLDGIYVIRTSVVAELLTAPETVSAYKSLSQVEQAFRCYKSVDLQVRPIFHHLADRVKAHIFLCMLAYYVEWHMRQALAPLLFDEDDLAHAQSLRESVVAPAKRSAHAQRKAQTKHTVDGLPVHSFQSLLANLATLVKNRVESPAMPTLVFDKITQPTPLQHKAFELLGVSL